MGIVHLLFLIVVGVSGSKYSILRIPYFGMRVYMSVVGKSMTIHTYRNVITLFAKIDRFLVIFF